MTTDIAERIAQATGATDVTVMNTALAAVRVVFHSPDGRDVLRRKIEAAGFYVSDDIVCTRNKWEFYVDDIQPSQDYTPLTAADIAELDAAVADIDLDTLPWGNVLPWTDDDLAATAEQPWTAWKLSRDSDRHERYIITTADGHREITGIVYNDADAERIVECVNGYPALRAKLESATRVAQDGLVEIDKALAWLTNEDASFLSPDVDLLIQALNMRRSALAKVYAVLKPEPALSGD